MYKEEMQEIVCSFLAKNPKTQFKFIQEDVENVLKCRGEVGKKLIISQDQQVVVEQIRISDEDAIMLMEIVYDLIVERVITPGIDSERLFWPFLTVTNKNKLKNIMINGR